MKSMLIFVALATLAVACGGGDTPVPAVPTLPTVSINNVTLLEGNTTTIFPFKVTLSKATDKPVTVNFATADLSAVAGTDYTAKTGTLTIPTGNTEGVIEIVVLGDTVKQEDKTFTVTLSLPTNATLSQDKGTGTIRNDDTYTLQTALDGYTTPKTYAGYNNAWADEFEASELDLTAWGYDVGGGGWGNNELQYYTNRKENAYLTGGNLVIEAKKEAFSNRDYTSARLVTKGKKEFTFGRVDIRAKLPVGKGLWPALWMLGKKIDQTSWPACGEIDIMELVGKEANKVHGTMHWGPTSTAHYQFGTNYKLATGDFSQKFHVYSLIWQADNIEILVDDVSYCRFNKSQVGNEAFPFNEPFFFIFNVAVGGDWPGSPDAATTFPQRMFVDYVRVFKKL